MAESEMETFLQQLWGEGPDQGFLLIWTAGNKKSWWYRTTRQVVSEAELWGNYDTYIGCGVAGDNNGPNKRAKANEVIAIPGLWSDIDLAGPGHKKQNLPRTEDDALGLLAKCGLKPTMIVKTGGGLQAWWIFQEPMTIADDEEREKVARLSVEWHKVLISHAKLSGYDVDATHDLARVFRLPGTQNLKIPGQPRLVSLLSRDFGPRYQPSDFEQFFLPAASLPKKSETPVSVEGVSLSEDSQVRIERLDELLEMNPKIRATWERKRKDFADQSGSAYCFALAIFATDAGWSDQEIADLMLTWRRKHHEDPKANRPDWYAMTIRKAKERRLVEKAEEALTSDGEDLSKLAVLKSLSTVLGINLRSIVQTGDGDHARYTLVLTNGKRVVIGGPQSLFRPASWRDAIAVGCQVGVDFSLMKMENWHRVVRQRILPIVDVEAPEFGDLGHECSDALHAYLVRRRLTMKGSARHQKAVTQGLPFTDGDALWISAKDFAHILDDGKYWTGRTGHAAALQLLRALGMAPVTVGIAGSSRYYYTATFVDLSAKTSLLFEDFLSRVEAN